MYWGYKLIILGPFSYTAVCHSLVHLFCFSLLLFLPSSSSPFIPPSYSLSFKRQSYFSSLKFSPLWLWVCWTSKRNPQFLIYEVLSQFNKAVTCVGDYVALSSSESQFQRVLKGCEGFWRRAWREVLLHWFEVFQPRQQRTPGLCPPSMAASWRSCEIE